MNNLEIEKQISVTFLYPSFRVGGAQLLFIRLAKELSKLDRLSVNVVDYPRGFLESELLQSPRVKIIPYIDGTADIPAQTIVVTPLSNLANIKYMVLGDLKTMNFLFWSIHPSNLSHVFNAYGRKLLPGKAIVKEKVVDLAINGNVIYMDEANFLSVKELVSRPIEPKYLPIPIELNVKCSKRIISSELINIGWLGRVSFDKINSIIKIVDEIKEIKGEAKTIFHVIGNGEKMDELKSYLIESGISYVLADALVGNDLDEYIDQYIDLGIAMGTSSMEFAARKIPVLLIDYSFVRFPAKIKYNWLFETEGYTLGGDIRSVKDRSHEFKDAIHQFKSERDLGERCYKYVKESHGIEEISRNLVRLCEELNPMDYKALDMIQQILNPFFYYFLYSKYRKFKGI